MGKHSALRGIFVIRGNGAKWRDAPPRFRCKSPVCRWFTTSTGACVLEGIMRLAGRLDDERDGYRLYVCLIDAILSKAKGNAATASASPRPGRASEP